MGAAWQHPFGSVTADILALGRLPRLLPVAALLTIAIDPLYIRIRNGSLPLPLAGRALVVLALYYIIVFFGAGEKVTFYYFQF